MTEMIASTYKLRQYASRIESVRSRISNLDGRLDRLYLQVDSSGVYNLLQADILTGNTWRLKQCQAYLEDTALDLEAVEAELSSYDPSNFSAAAVMQYAMALAQTDISNINATTLVEKFSTELLDVFGMIGCGVSESLFWVLSKVEFESSESWGSSYTKEKEVSEQKELFSYKGIIGEEVDDDDDDDDDTEIKITLIERSVSASASFSAISDEVGYESEYVNASASYSVANAEAHRTAVAGFYVESEDGTLVFSPKVSAEVGASVSAISVEAEGRVGTDVVGAYAKGEASALEASATAEASISAEKIYVGAEAQANLVSAEGSAGATVLGTEVGVTGSVCVGIGAKANIGCKDGTVKIEVGVACGVGASVGLEINFSNTVSTIVGLCESIFN